MQVLKLAIATLFLTTTAWQSWADESLVDEERFVVLQKLADGNETLEYSRTVPLIPNRACFAWVIRLKQRDGIIKYHEILTLPSAPEFWSGEGDPNATNEISADRRSSISNRFAALRNGWFTHTWCIAKGDPAGAHLIEIRMNGSLLSRFDFEVVRPGS